MRRSSAFAAVPAPQPIADLNTTPLIDVMLVLLIMFILTVPIATHKVALDLPTAGVPATPPTMHRLVVATDGAIRLDGKALDEAALAVALRPIAADPNATLGLAPAAEARYETVDRVLAVVKRAGVERMGFAG